MSWWCSATGRPWTWAWQAYPGIWLTVLGLALAGGRWRVGRGAWPRRARWTFAVGVLVLWGALDWPLGALGSGYLLSAHTLQYVLLTFVAAPLALRGLALPSGAQRPLPGAHPVLCVVVYTVAVGATHLPPPVDGLMTAPAGAMLLDLFWVAGGLALWWPVLHPEPRARLPGLAQVAYLLASTLLPTVPAAMMTFSPFPLYRIYELAPPLGSITAHGDQVAAGLLMKFGGDPVIWWVATTTFFREARELA